MLRRQGIHHRVLNAKRPAEEAEIVAAAGRRGAVTVSTNMAGRGTDIRLEAGVAEMGGLYVIGTERHQSSRVDLQLRGRSGRQGDPGRSRFFVSVEDELFKRFGHSESLMRWFERFGHEEGVTLEHSMLSRSLTRAQKQLEEFHSKNRRLTLNYDDVLHAQRTAVYDWREDILSQESGALLDSLIDQCDYPLETEAARYEYDARWSSVEAPMVEYVQRRVLLSTLDSLWQQHLEWLEALREDVSFEAIAQRDPLLEYRRRAFERFQALEVGVREATLQQLFALEPPRA
jgi:preprotein translocase subunit SecA